VSGRDSKQEGIEDWVADFQSEAGHRDDQSSSRYVQWLSVDGLQDITTHRRYSLLSEVQDDSGISLISHPELPAFSDAEKSRISCHEDHVVAVVQYGRSLPTLARICNSLLDPRLLSSAISLSDVKDGVESAAGEELSDRDVLDMLNKATQLGYLSEDEVRDFVEWRDRWSKIPPRLLSRMGELSELSGNALVEERGELYRRLHGAIASATALYRLAGNDVTIQIRFPDVDGILSNEQLVDDLSGFVRQTIPKNALVNNLHSWHRENIEKDEEKLKKRISPDYQALISEGTTEAESTVDWQFVGDKGTELLPVIQDALAEIEKDIREQVRDGDENGMPLKIPVRRGNHHSLIKKLIRRIADEKGLSLPSRADSGIERYTTMFEAVLGTDTAGPSPFSVATALLTLRGNRDGEEMLTVGDIASGLSHLRSPELLPCSGKTTEKRMLSALLGASGPLSRSELIERANVSRGSTQNLDTLEALELIEQTDDGYWRATIEPWWAATSTRSSPYERNERTTSPSSLSRWNHVVEHALERTGKLDTLSVQEYCDLYHSGLKNALRILEWSRFYPVLLHYTASRYDSDPGPVTTIGEKMDFTDTKLTSYEKNAVC
jgi:hypothetical protein